MVLRLAIRTRTIPQCWCSLHRLAQDDLGPLRAQASAPHGLCSVD